MRRRELEQKSHLHFASELRSGRRDAITAVPVHANRVHVTEFRQQISEECLL
jgi:hypothetical protein